MKQKQTTAGTTKTRLQFGFSLKPQPCLELSHSLSLSPYLSKQGLPAQPLSKNKRIWINEFEFQGTASKISVYEKTKSKKQRKGNTFSREMCKWTKSHKRLHTQQRGLGTQGLRHAPEQSQDWLQGSLTSGLIPDSEGLQRVTWAPRFSGKSKPSRNDLFGSVIKGPGQQI